MEGNIFEFESRDGSNILIELDESQTSGGMVEVSANGVMGKAEKSIEESLDTIKHLADAVVDKIKNAASKPDEVKVEFGIKFSADAGAFVAKVGAEAHLKLIMTWKNS
jgi:predicted membrane GTPase involved in stress response